MGIYSTGELGLDLYEQLYLIERSVEQVEDQDWCREVRR